MQKEFATLNYIGANNPQNIVICSIKNREENLKGRLDMKLPNRTDSSTTNKNAMLLHRQIQPLASVLPLNHVIVFLSAQEKKSEHR